MSTRNLTVVVKNKEIKVAQYCQILGEPDVQGIIVLDFLKKYNKDILKFSLIIDTLTKIEHGSFLLKFLGANILESILKKEITEVKLDSEFANDSLSCEWCYLIDLDKMRFEIYKGFNKKKLSKNDRFYISDEDSSTGYYPVKKIKTYDIYNLPTNELFSNRMSYYL